MQQQKGIIDVWLDFDIDTKIKLLEAMKTFDEGYPNYPYDNYGNLLI